MATSSQVKAGLDSIAEIISTERQALNSAKARITASKQMLNALPTTYSDVIATIDGYTPTGAFEELSQAEKATLVTEFLALKAKATTAETDLSAIDFTV